MSRASPVPLPPKGKIYFGATNFEEHLTDKQTTEEHYESLIGRKFAIDRFFVAWGNQTFASYMEWTASQGRIPLINIMTFQQSPGSNPSGVLWKDIGNGSQNTYLIWLAKTLPVLAKGPYFLCFSPEPTDNTGSKGFKNGTASDYIAAWSQVRKVFDQYGASATTAFIVTFTSKSFIAGAQPSGSSFFPGKNVVDWIACDAYNFIASTPSEDVDFTTNWHNLSSKTGALPWYTWSVKQGLPLAITEFGCKEWETSPGNPATLNATKKSGWFANLPNDLSGIPNVRAILYYNANSAASTSKKSGYPSRNWLIDTTPQSLNAFTKLINLPMFSWENYDPTNPLSPPSAPSNPLSPPSAPSNPVSSGGNTSGSNSDVSIIIIVLVVFLILAIIVGVVWWLMDKRSRSKC
jgi:hypothetical protein